MKIKLISLLAALLCFTLVLVSCGEKCTHHTDANEDGICDTEGCEHTIQLPEPFYCEDHKDENGDGKCDTENCEAVVDTVIEEVEVKVEIPVSNPLEEKVDMVIKPIPAEFVLGDYFTYAYDEDANKLVLYKSGIANIKTAEIVAQSDTKFWIETTSVVTPAEQASDGIATYQFTYTYVDLATGTTKAYVIEGAYKAGTSPEKEYGFSGDIAYIDMYNASKQTTYFHYITATAKEFAKSENLGRIVSDNDQYTYFKLDNVIYAIDKATNECVYSIASDLFIARPEFDEVCGDYAIVYTEAGLQVFTTAVDPWINMVYEYELPAYAESVQKFVLENGNVLYQYRVELPDNAVNFDYATGNEKFDVVYEIVNPAEKTATKVEFGYAIMYDVKDYFGNTTDKALNVFAVAPLDNITSYKILVVDNELNILAELKTTVAGQISPITTVVADNRMIVTVQLGDNMVYALVDETGKLVRYISEEQVQSIVNGFILMDDVLYNLDMTVKYDFVKNGFSSASNYGLGYAADNNFYLLQKTVNEGTVDAPVYKTYYYTYNPLTDTEPKKMENITSISNQTYDYFVAKNVVEGDSGSIVTYDLYTTNGQKLDSFTYQPYVYELVEVAEGVYRLNVYVNGVYEYRVYTTTAPTPAA